MPRTVPPHALRAAADAQTFSVTLLDGVTGSGKTEVYFEAVARTLEKGRQALIMLPEIALTSQFMDRFTRRFGCPPVEWHSALSSAERGRAWRAAATGEARVVVGARSALFLPFKDLGLIVVDEEHDTGFKQDDRVHYQGRDMAVVRGSLGKFAVVLASATPSIESHVNARTGRYAQVRAAGPLLRRRAAARSPAIDLRQHPPERGKWLSPVLVEAVTQTLAASSRRCCSSTAAAMRRSRCAAPAATASTARSARPGWSSTATATASTATTAASRCRSPRSAPSAASRTRSSPAARASSASPRRWRSGFRRHARRCCPPTSCRRSSRCARSSRPSRRARPTSSSARRWWPRATTSRSSPPSASSTAIWGSARPTRAPASAPSSSCTR